MLHSKFNRIVKKVVSDDMTIPASAEAKICLNCPYPKCTDGWGKGCDYYRSELKKIRGKK